MKSKGPKKTAAQNVQTKKVFDVTRPGRMPVSPTSRPVIVGHKPQVKDPMMSDLDDARPLMDSTKKVTIQPSAGATAPVAGPAAHGNPSSVLANAAATGSDPSASPATVESQAELREPTRSSEGFASGNIAESESVGGSKEVEPASEASGAEKPAEQSAADSVATIATSSVVDDVPPPQEDAVQPQPKPPTTDSTSGLVFDEGDGKESSTPGAGGSFATDVAREPTRSSEGFASGNIAESELAGGSKKEGAATEQAVAGQAVVSHHKQSGGMLSVFVWLFIVILLTAVAIDILLDMGILNISNIPHTNFFPPN